MFCICMASTYDAIIIGLGAMGSAAADHLARRGRRVLGLERYTPTHALGSSHGRSRIIRLAYMEHPDYVPLLRRAYELWAELERSVGEPLLTLTGGLMIGAPESKAVSGAVESARTHGLPYELLGAAEARRRFPPLALADGEVALHEPQAGFLRPEACVTAHLRRAASSGAELRFEEPALSWESDERGVRVTTARGTFEAARLIIAPGAWAPQLLGDLGVPFSVLRQVLFWFEPEGGAAPFAPERFPIYIWETGAGPTFYGFPHQDGPPGGVKVAIHSEGDPTSPETIDRAVHERDLAAIRAALAGRITALGGRVLDAAVCMYTMTPDEHFVVGIHPRRPNVVVASPCSGHGFKFASVLGEVLADLAEAGATRHAIGLFAPARFE
jgi:sarcosine oxidase